MVEDVKWPKEEADSSKDTRPLINLDWEEIRNIVGWIVGAAAVVLIAWAPVKCSMDTNAKIAEAVEAGAHPLDAACAMSNGNGSSTTCTIRAAMKETSK